MEDEVRGVVVMSDCMVVDHVMYLAWLPRGLHVAVQNPIHPQSLN